jgi:hypothetical protein
MKIILPINYCYSGTGYTITITPWSSAIYSEGYAVWIDYNQNGVFTDAGEQVWSKAASTINPVSGSLRFPPQQL